MSPLFVATSKKMGGYTLVELILVMGIVGVLFGISGILVSDLIPKASVTAYSATLLGDIRQQQLRAMSGDAGSPKGVHIAADRYTLFSGAVYNASDPTNFVITIDEPYTLSTTFPSSTLIFEQGTGEVQNYASTSASVTIQNSEGGNGVATLDFNALGIPMQTP